MDDPGITPKSRFWTGVLAVLSALNVGAVWFAAQPGEAWHATTHAILAVGFGLWAYRRMQPDQTGTSGIGQLAAERLDRIERGIDSIALEVERIGEMERFASKILAARASELEPRASAAQPERLRADPPGRAPDRPE